MDFQGSALPQIKKNSEKSVQERDVEKKYNDFLFFFCDFYAFRGSPGIPKSTKKVQKKHREKERLAPGDPQRASLQGGGKKT